MDNQIPFLEQVHATIYQHMATSPCKCDSLAILCEKILDRLQYLKSLEKFDLTRR
jgi:hypothetical protein